MTPNWHLRLPGFEYDGEDPDGFLARDDIVDHLEAYAGSAPVALRGHGHRRCATRRWPSGYRVHTTDRTYDAANVVIAAGTFQHPRVPAFSDRLSAEITQLHSGGYDNPTALPDGGVLVVGGGQSGCQIAQELHEHGRRVALCTSRVGRLPRRYRGRDGMWWAVMLGMADESVDDLESPDERFIANPHISGRDGGQDINLHAFARAGITLLGRLEDVEGRQVRLADDLHDNLAVADTMATRFWEGVDAYVDKVGLDVPEEDVPAFTHG